MEGFSSKINRAKRLNRDAWKDSGYTENIAQVTTILGKQDYYFMGSRSILLAQARTTIVEWSILSSEVSFFPESFNEKPFIQEMSQKLLRFYKIRCNEKR